jgi:hypothetical protein
LIVFVVQGEFWKKAHCFLSRIDHPDALRQYSSSSPKYLQGKKVPQLFVASGASKFGAKDAFRRPRGFIAQAA